MLLGLCILKGSYWGLKGSIKLFYMGSSLRLSASFFLKSSYFRKARLSNDRKNVYMLCPSCGEDEFGISLAVNHRFGCFRLGKCGFKGGIHKLLSYLRISEEEVKSYTLNGSLSMEEMFVSSEESEEKDEVVSLPLWYKDKGSAVDGLEPCRSYMDSRVGENNHEHIEWGYTPLYRDYIIFPIRMGGNIVNWNGRSLSGSSYPRYRLGYHSSSTLYGIDDVSEATDTIVIVEGMFDKFSVDSWIKNRGHSNMCCIATMGSFMTKNKLDVLKSLNTDNILLWYEQDNKFMRKKFYNTLCVLRDHFDVCYSVFDTFDPGDADHVQLDRALEDKERAEVFFNKNMLELI